MSSPPRLLARTFDRHLPDGRCHSHHRIVVITLDVRDRVRADEIDKLRVSENVCDGLENKRQQDQVAAMPTLAENPTLKARSTPVSSSGVSALLPTINSARP